MTSDHELAARALACLDLTALGDEDEQTIDALCANARSVHGPVGAVCTWAEFVPRTARLLGGAVPIATVVNFPQARDDAHKVLDDAAAAVAAGADEIDVVAPWHALLAGDEATYVDVLEAAREGTGEALLKVIIETGELETPAAIRRATELCIEHGADFVKTSTGKTPVSATPEAADAMLGVIAAADRPVGFKVSGGVRTLADARVFEELVIRHLGADAVVPARYRIGASSLLGALLDTLRG